MAYILKWPEAEVQMARQFVNAAGQTECVEFVQQAAGAPQTTAWRRGVRVLDTPLGAIRRGTAIATFDEQGHYPTDTLGKHAAIYLSHDRSGIRVLDQWRDQDYVQARTIRADATARSRCDCARYFYVIE